ncbi:MAG: hypothetical protein KTQ49_04480 [Candidatus Omnitrophica bacterium]|nr:hypothetical protein [Candidatus Omnitrophota bacterium]
MKAPPSPANLELVNVTVVRGKENMKLLDRVSLTVSPGENVATMAPKPLIITL